MRATGSDCRSTASCSSVTERFAAFVDAFRGRCLGGRWSGPGAQSVDQSGGLFSDRARTYVLLMRLFGRSPALGHDAEAQIQLAWLAGLLEAEGSFLRPTPSEPRFPSVACQMTDRDVVEQVGSLFGTAVMRIPRNGRRTMYATRIKGSRAVVLMRDLAPAMSRHRRRAITAALGSYVPPSRKLDFASAKVIRDSQSCVSVSGLAREFGVARSTIVKGQQESPLVAR